MSTNDLNTSITEDDVTLGLFCYSCGKEITWPEGGEWIEMRPNTAYSWCAACLTPEAQ